MREKSMTFSTWYEGRLYDWWPEGQPAPPEDKLDDVQLCVVYEANTKYWREAVNDAWDKLRSGYIQPILSGMTARSTASGQC